MTVQELITLLSALSPTDKARDVWVRIAAAADPINLVSVVVLSPAGPMVLVGFSPPIPPV